MTMTCSRGLDRLEPLEGFPAAFHRHVDIEQSDIEAAFSEVLYGFSTVFRNHDVIIFGSECRAQSGEHFYVIIRKQHFCFHVLVWWAVCVQAPCQAKED